MRNAILGFICCAMLALLPCYCRATVFAGRDHIEYVVEKAQFLETIGVTADFERSVGDDGNSYLALTLTSLPIYDFDDTKVELVYVDSNDNVVLGIDDPFANTKHSTRYWIPSGFKMIVSVVTSYSRDSKYHKVIFE